MALKHSIFSCCTLETEGKVDVNDYLKIQHRIPLNSPSAKIKADKMEEAGEVNWTDGKIKSKRICLLKRRMAILWMTGIFRHWLPRSASFPSFLYGIISIEFSEPQERAVCIMSWVMPGSVRKFLLLQWSDSPHRMYIVLPYSGNIPYNLRLNKGARIFIQIWWSSTTK